MSAQTRHTYCSHHAQLIILSLSSTYHTSRQSLRDGGEMWVEKRGGVRGGWRQKKQRREERGKKRVEDVLNQETERSWHKDEKQNSRAPEGLGVYV